MILAALFSFFGVIIFATVAGAVGDATLEYLAEKNMRGGIEMTAEERKKARIIPAASRCTLILPHSQRKIHTGGNIWSLTVR